MTILQKQIIDIVKKAEFYADNEAAEAAAFDFKKQADTITDAECCDANFNSGSTDLVVIAEWVVSARIKDQVNINRKLLLI